MNNHNKDNNNIENPLLYIDDIILSNTENNNEVMKMALKLLEENAEDYNLKISDDKLKINGKREYTKISSNKRKILEKPSV